MDASSDPYRLRHRGITDARVLSAMAAVPRARFLPPAYQHEAFGDYALPIECGQTISQPFIVAWMTQELRVEPGQKVLEIGTGSGYQTAVLAELGAEVYSIEIVPELAEQARQTLADLGYLDRLHLRVGNGYDGWPDAAPFDRVILTASPPDIPSTLLDQLADGGRLVGPVGVDWQELVVVDKRDGRLSRHQAMAVRFVPMVDN